MLSISLLIHQSHFNVQGTDLLLISHGSHIYENVGFSSLVLGVDIICQYVWQIVAERQFYDHYINHQGYSVAFKIISLCMNMWLFIANIFLSSSLYMLYILMSFLYCTYPGPDDILLPSWLKVGFLHIHFKKISSNLFLLCYPFVSFLIVPWSHT